MSPTRTSAEAASARAATSPSWEDVRAEFPALEDKTFLDAACVGIAPRVAAEAIGEFLEATLRCPSRSATEHHLWMDAQRNRVRALAARLLGAEEDEIALVESTTHGLSVAAASIPLRRGDRVLLGDLEFLELALPWCQLRDRIGIEIDVVPHRGGELRIEDVAGRMTPRTAVVAVSSVQWTNGFRCDLGRLGALCREAGAWLVVDAVQQLGAIPIDVRAAAVDVLVAGGHKWLNAPFGAGLLYLRRESRNRLEPPLGGYLSLETPEGGWGRYFQTPSIRPIGPYRFVDEARRFEIGGTANDPGALGLAASIELLLRVGPERAARRIAELTSLLVDELDRRGLRVVTPRAPEARAGIVTFTLGSAEKDLALMTRLLEGRILVSTRYTSGVGGVRVSCHYYNAVEDIDRLLGAVDAALRGR